jgi:hypothetical protein
MEHVLCDTSHRRWYGGGDDGDRGSVGPRSRRASVVLAGALGVMAVVLVISPADLAKTGMMKRVNPSADREAGTFVVRETDTLLGRAAAEVRLQRLFDMSSVTRAAQRELASDETTLKSLSSSRGWGGSGDGNAQLQSSDGGPAGVIIASATAVYEKASKLAGDPARSPRLSLGGAAAQATDDDDVSAEADAVASTVSAVAPKPFAKDKGWSLAKEKSDMDNFYDSLDHNLVSKEAAARKKRAADAAFRATVAKAHEELKAIEAKTAAKPAEHATTLAKDPKAFSKPAAATAASPAVAHPVVKADPQVVRTTPTPTHTHTPTPTPTYVTRGLCLTCALCHRWRKHLSTRFSRARQSLPRCPSCLRRRREKRSLRTLTLLYTRQVPRMQTSAIPRKSTRRCPQMLLGRPFPRISTRSSPRNTCEAP